MSGREIRINGLTQEQISMLDLMWNLQTQDDYHEWYGGLSESQADMADSLKLLLFLAILESAAEEEVEDLSIANNYLKKFMLEK